MRKERSLLMDLTKAGYGEGLSITEDDDEEELNRNFGPLAEWKQAKGLADVASYVRIRCRSPRVRMFFVNLRRTGPKVIKRLLAQIET
jgi:hypothetical protein